LAEAALDPLAKSGAAERHVPSRRWRVPSAFSAGAPSPATLIGWHVYDAKKHIFNVIYANENRMLIEIAEILGMAWGFVAFDAALKELVADNNGPLVQWLNSQPIVIDLNQSSGEMDLESLFDPFAADITQPVTVYGGPEDNFLIGGAGDDRFFFADSASDGLV